MSASAFPVLPFAAAALCLITAAGWFLVPAPDSRQSRLWFSGIAVYALASVLLAFQSALPQAVVIIITTALPLLSVALATESLRRDTGRQPIPLAVILLAPWIHLSVMLAVRAGAGSVIAQVTHIAVMTGIELYMLGLMTMLGRRYASRSLLVCGLALGAICMANFVRIGQWLTDSPMTPLTGHTPASMALVIVFSLGVTVMSLGYWGFLLERGNAERLAATEAAARANEAQRLTESFNARLKELLQQRERMIMEVSRFSTLGNLAVFNAGIVHEVSQPLQALLSYLETIEMDARTQATGSHSAELEKARDLALEAAQILQALRRLSTAAPPADEQVGVVPLMKRILPIIESECSQRRVSFQSRRDTETSQGHVCANAVMLERVILNLVTNGLEALCAQGAAAPGARLTLDCRIERLEAGAQPLLAISVSDNGPGVTSENGPPSGNQPITTKPEGMGIGLLWVRLLVEQWGGEFELRDRPEADGPGATATVRLPLRGMA